MSRTIWLAVALLFAVAGCGGKRTDTEHLLIRWAEVLNFHLAGSFADGNEYPHRLADVDPMLRIGVTFVDAWGNPIHYRRIDDGHYDLASPGPDGVIGNDDDVVVHNGLTQKPSEVWAARPPARGLSPQQEQGGGAGEVATGGDEAGDDGESYDDEAE